MISSIHCRFLLVPRQADVPGAQRVKHVASAVSSSSSYPSVGWGGCRPIIWIPVLWYRSPRAVLDAWGGPTAARHEGVRDLLQARPAVSRWPIHRLASSKRGCGAPIDPIREQRSPCG